MRPCEVQNKCIGGLRSMHSATGDEDERCIKSNGLSRRSASPAVVNGENIRTEPSQSAEINGIETPAHTEGYQ